MAHFGGPVRESGAHCWQAGWLLASWLATGTPGVEAIWSEEGNPPVWGGMVTTKHRLPRYQTTNILRNKDTKVKTYEVTKATILPVTTNASQPGGPHKGGRRIYTHIYTYIYIYI